MRVRKTKQGFTVQAIAGSHMVLLAMNMPKADCDGHPGFAIHRTDHTEQEAYWLDGMKSFAETDPVRASSTWTPATDGGATILATARAADGACIFRAEIEA